MSESFAGAVGGLSSIVAQNVVLTLDCTVPLKAAHTPYKVDKEERNGRTVAVVTIPDLFAGERRDILVELEAPAAEADETVLLNASVCYTNLKRNVRVQSSTVDLKTVRVDEPQPELEPDEEVSSQRQRVEVTRALVQATAESDQGNFEKAQATLDSAERSLQSRGKQTKLTFALHEELTDARCKMSSRSVWEHGGKAECVDAVQMHLNQRCSMGTSMKQSRSMYANHAIKSKITLSKAS